MSLSEFKQVLQGLWAGTRPIEHGYNEFIGHADTVRQLLEVAPDPVRETDNFWAGPSADSVPPD